MIANARATSCALDDSINSSNRNSEFQKLKVKKNERLDLESNGMQRQWYRCDRFNCAISSLHSVESRMQVSSDGLSGSRRQVWHRSAHSRNSSTCIPTRLRIEYAFWCPPRLFYFFIDAIADWYRSRALCIYVIIVLLFIWTFLCRTGFTGPAGVLAMWGNCFSDYISSGFVSVGESVGSRCMYSTKPTWQIQNHMCVLVVPRLAQRQTMHSKVTDNYVICGRSNTTSCCQAAVIHHSRCTAAAYLNQICSRKKKCLLFFHFIAFSVDLSQDGMQCTLIDPNYYEKPE